MHYDINPFARGTRSVRLTTSIITPGVIFNEISEEALLDLFIKLNAIYCFVICAIKCICDENLKQINRETKTNNTNTQRDRHWTTLKDIKTCLTLRSQYWLLEVWPGPRGRCSASRCPPGGSTANIMSDILCNRRKNTFQLPPSIQVFIINIYYQPRFFCILFLCIVPCILAASVR